MFISILFESVPYRRYVTYTTRRYRMLMNKKKTRANLRDVFRFLPRSYERYIALNRASDLFFQMQCIQIYSIRESDSTGGNVNQSMLTGLTDRASGYYIFSVPPYFLIIFVDRMPALRSFGLGRINIH